MDPGIAAAAAGVAGCRVREILDRIGHKWSLFVIFRLGEGPRRFTVLKRSVDGISQRMLSVILRGLERDGIVSRTMYPVMPPRVDFFFQAEDGIRDLYVTGVQTCALPI